MAIAARNDEATRVLTELEEIWRCLDELFAGFTAADWRRRHGRDWRFADLPYHLHYFDREVVLRALERRRDVPAEAQRGMRTLRELNDWNARMFARRPPGETPEDSLARMRAARDELRQAIGRLSDADLDEPVFVDLVGMGWVPTRLALAGAVGHTWTHYQEARLRLRRAAQAPSPGATHRALGFYMTVMAGTVDPAEAARGPFTAVMAFTGPDGRAWTLRVGDGRVQTEPGAAPDADLTVTQRPESFVATMTGLQNPMLALLTGRMRVRGFGKMGRFGRLFAMPKPDAPIALAHERPA